MTFIRKVKDLLLGRTPAELLSLVTRARQITDHTPDIVWLEKRRNHAVFIYDEMMSGFPKHNLLEKGKVLGRAFTHKENFTMMKKKLGQASFPIPVRNPDGKGHRILGELYLVPSREIILLDKYKKNGVLFSRQRVTVDFPQRCFVDGKLSDEITTKVSAWMYIGKRSFWEGQFDGGYNYSPVQTFEPHEQSKPPYYLFTRDDLKTS